LIGRVTYEGFAGAWPQREGGFADKMNAMPKHVVSSTLTDPGWSNTTVITGDVPEEVAKLKEGRGSTTRASSSTCTAGRVPSEGSRGLAGAGP
jgi:dihydrofolate reductase